MSMLCNGTFCCTSQLVFERDGTNRLVAPSQGPVVIQPTTRTRYARRVLTHDKIHTSCFEAASAPYHVCFFYSFSPLPLSLISPRAFSHGVSFRLVPSPRGDSVSDALDAFGLQDRLALGSKKPSEHVSCESSARVSENEETCYARAAAANVYADTIDTSLYN